MKPRTKLLLAALALALFAWAGVALAQAAGGFLGFIPDLAALYVSPFALAVAVGAIVEVAKNRLLNVSGTAVTFLSFAVGIVLGMGGVWAGYLAGNLIEGAAFGLISALIASGLYDLVKGFLARWGITLPSAPVEGQVLALASGGGLVNTVAQGAVQFVLDFVRGQVSKAQLPQAITAVAPLVAELLQSPVVLNDDTRSELQGRVLRLLRSAGLKGVDL